MFDPKAMKMVFMGYSSQFTGFLDHSTNCVTINRNARLLELRNAAEHLEEELKVPEIPV